MIELLPAGIQWPESGEEPLDAIGRRAVFVVPLDSHPPSRRRSVRMTRDDVERAILEDETFVGEVAALLEHRRELADWPEPARESFALALEPSSSASRTEEWKATNLRRHLFGGAGSTPMIPTPRVPSMLAQRRAERLRSDLYARVKFRAGTYLLASP